LAKLESGFHDMIQRCPKPLLAAPQTSTPLDRGLLAYDGSPKAEEALFVAAYLAVHWKITLTVISVIDEGSVTGQTLRRAQDYLEEQYVQALYIEETGTKPAEVILRAAEEQQSDLLLMGGYGTNPLLEVVLGSAVDQVLREAHKPVLICR
jgi:nucleotide-binding universal stress UspA family protein